MTEHEYDHVFAGVYEGPIVVNKSEVADYCYEEMEEIKWAINGKPAKFTAWFRLAFPTIETWWQQQYGRIEAQKI